MNFLSGMASIILLFIYFAYFFRTKTNYTDNFNNNLNDNFLTVEPVTLSLN